MARDWIAWHDDYADPASSLSRRLEVVRGYLRTALEACREPRVISMCAGAGRDVLPVLASAAPHANALLVELDPRLAESARALAAQLHLGSVRVETADAGVIDAYLGHAPAGVVLACGVFGNVPAADVRRTVAGLPSLLAPHGTVIWTRGRGKDEIDPSQDVRAWFADAGFEEVAFSAPADAGFRVGMHRLARAPDPLPPAGTVLFRFD